MCASPRWAGTGHGGARRTQAAASTHTSLHLTASGTALRPGLAKASSDSHSAPKPASPYLAAAVGDDRLAEGLGSFLDGSHDSGDVDDGCLAATQSLLCAVLGSLLQQGQECLGRSSLVGCLCPQLAPLTATATQPVYSGAGEEEQWETKTGRGGSTGWSHPLPPTALGNFGKHSATSTMTTDSNGARG